jgi:FtsH-binding integral membrane protein
MQYQGTHPELYPGYTEIIGVIPHNDEQHNDYTDDHSLSSIKPVLNLFKQQNTMYTEHIVRTIQTLFCQLVFTFMCISMVGISKTFRMFVINHVKEMITVGILGTFTTLIWIRVSNYKSRAQLALFTIFETMIICVICTLYNHNVILTAMLGTFGIISSLIVYAITTRNNHTMYSGFLCSSLVSLLITSIFNIFLKSSILEMLILYIGTLIFFGYIVCDVQYFFSKKAYDYVQTEGDAENVHIEAALSIYLDIINIFIRILKCASKIRND